MIFMRKPDYSKIIIREADNVVPMMPLRRLFFQVILSITPPMNHADSDVVWLLFRKFSFDGRISYRWSGS